MPLVGALFGVILQIMWMFHRVFEKFVPDSETYEDDSPSVMSHIPYDNDVETRLSSATSLGRKCLDDYELLSQVEEEMLRYACARGWTTNERKASNSFEQYSALPTKDLSRDVFTNIWIDSFGFTA